MISLQADPWFAVEGPKVDGYAELLEQDARIAVVEQRLAVQVEGTPGSDAVFGRRVLDEADFDIVRAAREVVDRDVVIRARGLIEGGAKAARGMLQGRVDAWVSQHEGDLCALLHVARVETAAAIRQLPADSREVVPLVDQWRALVDRHRRIIRLSERVGGVSGSESQAGLVFWPEHDQFADYAVGWPEFWRLQDAVTADGTDLGSVAVPWADYAKPLSVLEQTSKLRAMAPAQVAAMFNRFNLVWTPTRGELERSCMQLSRAAARLASSAVSEYDRRARDGFPSGQMPKEIQVTSTAAPEDIDTRELAGPGRIG